MTARNQSLDVLRGVAILLVLLNHSSRYFQFGWMGVDLFFVLSGFLISGLLFAEYQKRGTIRIGKFWMRRGFKIYPAFYASILVTFIAFKVTHSHLPPGATFWSDLLFIQNYVPCVMATGWSLAVEEHFYLMLPLALIVMISFGKRKQNPFRFLPLVSVLAFVACLYMRIKVSPQSFISVSQPTHLRIDSLFVGVTIGYFAAFDRKSFDECAQFWIAALGVIAVIVGWLLPLAVGLSFISLGFAPLVAYAGARRTCLIAFRPLAAIGRYSYSIYLWHVLVGITLARLSLPLERHWFDPPVFIASAIVTGTVMSKLIEIPVLRLRDSFLKDSERATQAVVLTPNSAAFNPDCVQAAPVFGSLSKAP